jgi:hypothetical protein
MTWKDLARQLAPPVLWKIAARVWRRYRRGGSVVSSQAVDPSPISQRCGISELSELLGKIKQALAVSGAEQQLSGLGQLFYKFDASPLRKLDPFGSTYKAQVLAIYRTISGNNTTIR